MSIKDKEMYFKNGEKYSQFISFEEMIRLDRWCPPKKWLDAIDAKIGDQVVFEKEKGGYLNYVLDSDKLKDLNCDLNNGEDILNALLEKYPEEIDDLVKIKAILRVGSQGRLGARHQLIKLFCGEIGVKKGDYIISEFVLDDDGGSRSWYVYYMKKEDIPEGYIREGDD
jgi:hypothetical protein